MSQAEAARRIGVTAGHLNMVLRGHRQSRSLQARWEALQLEEARRMSEETNPRFSQGTATAAGQAPGAADPVAANESIEWIETFGKVGLTVVVVQARWLAQLWAVNGFEEALGEELNQARLGVYDGLKVADHTVAFYCHCNTERLAAGLQLIKARLAAIGLLPMVKIGIADQEARSWRIFYPEAGQVGT